MQENIPFWQQHVWHHVVHLSLGERLYYYLVSVRPFDAARIKADIDKLLEENEVGGVRAFPLFGPYDLMVRAWLNPAMENAFQKVLREKIRSVLNVLEFIVLDIHERWYTMNRPDGKVDQEILRTLDDKVIQEAQSARSAKDKSVRELIEGGLIVPREDTGKDLINFFVAISLEDSKPALNEQMVTVLAKLISSADSGLRNGSTYSGSGFSHFLVKAQGLKLDPIYKMTESIYKAFSGNNPKTETYLVYGSGHLAGSYMIGKATFRALEGKSIFVKSVIPELYGPGVPSQKKRTIEEFLLGLQETDLTRGDKRFMREYLLGWLKDDSTEMAKVLFVMFSSLERYLRDNREGFVGRMASKVGVSPKDIYEGAEMDPGKEHFALGDLLKIYSVTIKKSGETGSDDLSDVRTSLAKLRNRIAHGAIDIMSEWKPVLTEVASVLPRLRELILTIGMVTGEEYRGLYLIK